MKKKKYRKESKHINNMTTTVTVIIRLVMVGIEMVTTHKDKTNLVTIMKTTHFIVDLLKRKALGSQDCMHKIATKTQLLFQLQKGLTKI